jgi:hypothetical protein
LEAHPGFEIYRLLPPGYLFTPNHCRLRLSPPVAAHLQQADCDYINRLQHSLVLPGLSSTVNITHSLSSVSAAACISSLQ